MNLWPFAPIEPQGKVWALKRLLGAPTSAPVTGTGTPPLEDYDVLEHEPTERREEAGCRLEA